MISKHFNLHSVRTRLAIWNVVILALTLLTTSVVIERSERSNAIAFLDDGLARTTLSIQRRLARPPRFPPGPPNVGQNSLYAPPPRERDDSPRPPFGVGNPWFRDRGGQDQGREDPGVNDRGNGHDNEGPGRPAGQGDSENVSEAGERGPNAYGAGRGQGSEGTGQGNPGRFGGAGQGNPAQGSGEPVGGRANLGPEFSPGATDRPGEQPGAPPGSLTRNAPDQGRIRPRMFNREGGPFFPDADRQDEWDAKAFSTALKGTKVYTDTVVDKTPMRVFSAPIMRGDRIVGVIQTATSKVPVDEEISRLARTELTLIPLVLIIAALGALFLTDRALRPVRRITQSASQIEAQNLSARLPVEGADEFAELSATFNGMLDRLEQAFSSLELAFQQQRRFTADASHEIRTPLTVIKANTSLALSAPRSAGQYRESLEAVDIAADRTSKIVQGLLLLARSDAGQINYKLEPKSLSDVLEEAVEMVDHGVVKTPVTLSDIDETLMVSADYDALLRLFTNLMENAQRYTPVDGAINVSAKRNGNTVVVTVTDTGEGIAAEHLPHITERFYRADPSRSRSHGGAGLGLAICKSIAEAHHGSLRVDSVLGHGTTVTVTLMSAPRE